MEALVARAEGPADTGKREAPHGRAGQGEHRVAPEPDAEDACGNRDERAHDGRDPTDQDGPVLVAVEPSFRALELRRRQMEPAAVALEQRAAAADADPPAGDRADEVAQRSGERDGDVGPEAVRHTRPEERDRSA